MRERQCLSWMRCAGVVVLAALAMSIPLCPALAEPTLQLYSPQGEYDPTTESWVIDHESAFELWVLAATQANATDTMIRNVRLSVAIPEGEWPLGGTVTMRWLDDAVPTGYAPCSADYDFKPELFQLADGIEPSYTALTQVLSYDPDDVWNEGELTGHYLYGTPFLGDPYDPKDGGLLPTHGEYPTYFTEVAVGDIDTKGDGSDYVIWDAQAHPDDETAMKLGQRYKVSISVTGFSHVYFDAHDGFEGKRAVFAPFSHDALYVPEPTSLAFLGVVASGALVRVLRKSLRKRAS